MPSIQGRDEILGGNMRLAQNAVERADSNLAMQRHDRRGRTPSQDHMTPTLAELFETQFLQRPHDLRPR